MNQYYVYVFQPLVYPEYLRKNFKKWRSIVETLAPNRVNSVIVNDTSKDKVLLFIVEGLGDVNKFSERVQKLFMSKILVKDSKGSVVW